MVVSAVFVPIGTIDRYFSNFLHALRTDSPLTSLLRVYACFLHQPAPSISPTTLEQNIGMENQLMMLHTFVGREHNREISAGGQHGTYRPDASTRETDQDIHVLRDIAPGVGLHDLFDSCARIKLLCARHCKRGRVLACVAAARRDITLCLRAFCRNGLDASGSPALLQHAALRNVSYQVISPTSS